MPDGRDDCTTARAWGLVLTTMTTTPSLSVYGDRLWDNHIVVLLIHELGHLIRKPQKSICVILAPKVALVQ